MGVAHTHRRADEQGRAVVHGESPNEDGAPEWLRGDSLTQRRGEARPPAWLRTRSGDRPDQSGRRGARARTGEAPPPSGTAGTAASSSAPDPTAAKAPRRTDADRPIDVLFVCTGNVCRSAFAEMYARARCRELGRALTIGSAGTAALVGQDVYEWMGVELAERGITPLGHRARQVTGRLLGQARLIVVFDRTQRRWIRRERPEAVERTVLLGRMERVLASADEGGGASEEPGTSEARDEGGGTSEAQGDGVGADPTPPAGLEPRPRHGVAPTESARPAPARLTLEQIAADVAAAGSADVFADSIADPYRKGPAASAWAAERIARGVDALLARAR